MSGTESLVAGVIIGMAFCVPIALFLLVIRQLLYICQPNEVLVFEGRKRRLADGSRLDYTVIESGYGVKIPLIENVRRLDLSTMTVDIQVNNAYSRGNIPLSVHAIANVKVCRRAGIIDNALERFLGRDREEIRQVAKETIEGALRGVLATLTPEQVNEERTTFVHALASDVEDDLNQLGLTIDTLNIQSVSDDVNYLDNIGRTQIANVLRDAEVAESDNKREAEQRIAEASARGAVARERAQGNIRRSENELRKVKADLEAQARSAEERTEQAAFEARARAEVKLQEVRSEVERLRLQAEEVLPAEAERTAARLRAEGQSATITSEGRATAEALRMVADVWNAAGESAEDIYVLQELENLFSGIADKLRGLEIEHVSLIDGGDGASLGRLAAAYPAMFSNILQTFGETTGIHLGDILQRKQKRALRIPAGKGGGGGSAPPEKSRFDAPRHGESRAERRISSDTGTAASTDAGSDESEVSLEEQLSTIRERVAAAEKVVETEPATDDGATTSSPQSGTPARGNTQRLAVDPVDFTEGDNS